LQKLLARAGVASRRAAEAYIRDGRVRVNGRVVTELGTRADPSRDRIELDGARLLAERPIYVVLHKPRGVVATLRDPEGRPCVGDMLGTLGVRVFPIGRLDFATSGVLLATNDGDFANALLHPRGGVPKRYVVKAAGKMEEGDLERWRRGVEIEERDPKSGRTRMVKTLPAEVELLRYEDDKTWIELTIREGRNQQIRRMGEATRFRVMRLARTSFAGVTSEGLAPGRWRYLTRQELVELKKTYGVPKRVPRDLPEGGGEGMASPSSRRREARQGGFGDGRRGSQGGSRYGLGAPARRDPTVTEDYAGGVRRGSRGSEARGDERRGRAAMPMRTTGKNTYGK
jgi:23S rRNA pseudouridine2605 synthase